MDMFILKKSFVVGLKFTWNWVSRVLAHSPVPAASGSPDSACRRGVPLSTLARPPEDPAIPRESVRQEGKVGALCAGLRSRPGREAGFWHFRRKAGFVFQPF